MTPTDVATWERALFRFRAQKDEFFKTAADSPLDEADRKGFNGLRYFRPNPALRFETRLNRYSEPKSLMMTTSKGTRRLFNNVGCFELLIGGSTLRLEAYQAAERDDPSLFIPFRDATSGKESYGAARYLDINVEHNDEYVVDFNYAYNPYCAYSEDYVCPLPPRENWLTSRVEAGEMKFHD